MVRRRPKTVPTAPTSRNSRRLAWGLLGIALGGLCAVYYFAIHLSHLPGRRETSSPPTQADALSEDRPVVDSSAPTKPRSGSLDGLTLISVSPTGEARTLADELAGKQEARADEWDSEIVSESIQGQIDRLRELLHDAPGDLSKFQEVFADDVQGTPLRPKVLTNCFDRAPIVVQRGPDKSSQGTLLEVQGVAGITQSVAALTQVLGTNPFEIKFKLFHVEPYDQGVRTRMYFEAGKRTAERAVQQTAIWACDWELPSDNDRRMRIRKIEVEDYEETVLRLSGGSMFVDSTKSVLEGNRSYQEQLLRGIPYWLTRISREFMTQFGHNGVAVGDVNGDDLDDLYICDSGGLPNRLYVQQPDGTALDVSADSGTDLLEDSLGALLIDLDNDGDQDLVVATDPLLHFGENDGTGKFRWHEPFYGDTDAYSLCAADYDQDQDLDIYVCGYNARRQDPMHRGLPFPLPYHDANNGGQNYLLRNDGQFHFVDVTNETGLSVNNSRFSLAAAWEDYDNDGDLDLYVANDFGRNNLYRNDGGRFVDMAAAAGVEDQASGMSVSWADYNHDGWMDVYVSNMFSAAGNRVTYQRKFRDGLSDETVSSLRRMARGNTLFQNRGDGTFGDTSEQAAVTLGRWAWASRFVDLNNDGWEDLVVANGYVTNDDTGDL